MLCISVCLSLNIIIVGFTDPVWNVYWFVCATFRLFSSFSYINSSTCWQQKEMCFLWSSKFEIIWIFCCWYWSLQFKIRSDDRVLNYAVNWKVDHFLPCLEEFKPQKWLLVLPVCSAHSFLRGWTEIKEARIVQVESRCVSGWINIRGKCKIV